MEKNKTIVIKKKKTCDKKPISSTEEYKNTEQELLANAKNKPLEIEKDDVKVDEVKTIMVRDDKNVPIINDILANIPKNTNE